jgi:hypothetical protein
MSKNLIGRATLLEGQLMADLDDLVRDLVEDDAAENECDQDRGEDGSGSFGHTVKVAHCSAFMAAGGHYVRKPL